MSISLQLKLEEILADDGRRLFALKLEVEVEQENSKNIAIK